MTKEVDDLLTAEQAVQDLLKELQSLKTQVGGYETARKALDAVRASLERFVDETIDLAGKTHVATATLEKIGTPEILTRIEAVKAEISELSAQSTRRGKSLRVVGVLALLVALVSMLASIAILAKLFLPQ